VTLEVRVERARCIGSKTCVHRLPEVFQLDSSGIAVVAGPGRASDEELMAAAEDCPTGAISVSEEAGA
jgi:ferredoxin